ncbi:dipeptide/oligopeptide/nickel ABC transporter permease/ATP-binding protein [Paenibacillus radicis (ex Xue et al. 2023)]|uniref:Nickel import system ATP-binding protein NikD n=1 Tax=Paenibacillus radicis (ex Xue et al. 2023) TaxID=2972489 RepID=A0ABT1YEQ0_9BACL|nr:dipeptide/oligopeptide/nickel ABC transporter permease/ATP-binding protein [Paenibacillus radicis (ex Xue et al. 2023)]MCR8631676.1 dipeptide/oligopeptide/nickel ABC transporter permease/ATP-binding protein [Paenibacillus radicis (ex Xue et al. 2023)]
MNHTMAKKIGIAGILMLSFILLLAIIGPLVVPFSSYDQTGLPLQAPGGLHMLGTNDMGQDIAAELVEGARVSLLIGIASAILATLIGALIGLLAGYSGGWLDNLFMRIVDVSLTLPYLPLMIVIGVYMGPSLITQIFIITLVMWAGKAREIRSQVMSLRTRGPVLAAQSMGASGAYLLRRHIFPGIIPLLIPQFVRAVNTSILLESSLSFLGLGDPLSKSWGSILFYANARSAFLTDAWMWWVLPPGLCIVITVVSFSFLGYWMEELISPRLRSYLAVLSGKKASAPNLLSTRTITSSSHAPVLEVDGLTIGYPKGSGMVHAAKSVSFSVGRGEVLGIVGESGSGKSTVASSIIQLLKAPAVLLDGAVRFCGTNLTSLSAEEMQRLRGNRIALIPQAAMNALNPVMTVRAQLAEAILSHRKMSKLQVNNRINLLLKQVGLAPERGSAYPHELSGGMRQRVIIAMALINDPDLVIADEPTTGLDVKVQLEIIELLKHLQKQLGLSMVFISHDLPVVLKLSDRIVIMNQGEIVDQGTSNTIARISAHPYTRRLIDSVPRLTGSNQEPKYSYSYGGIEHGS